jgi:hypothetical protein
MARAFLALVLVAIGGIGYLIFQNPVQRDRVAALMAELASDADTLVLEMSGNEEQQPDNVTGLREIWTKDLAEGHSIFDIADRAAGGVYAVGNITRDGYLDGLVMAIGPDGVLLWQKSLGGQRIDQFQEVIPSIDRLVDLVELSDGGVIVVGESNNEMDGDIIFETEGRVARLDSGGQVIWDRAVNSMAPPEHFIGVQRMPNGEIFGFISENATARESKTLTVVKISEDGAVDVMSSHSIEGDIHVSRAARSPGGTNWWVGSKVTDPNQRCLEILESEICLGKSDWWLLNHEDSGDAVEKVFAIGNDGHISDLLVEGETALLVGMTTRNDESYALLARVDPTAEVMWSIQADGIGSPQDLHRLARAPDARVIATGAFNVGDADSNIQGWIGGLEQDGYLNWTETLAKGKSSQLLGVVAKPDGVIFVDGRMTERSGGGTHAYFLSRFELMRENKR